MKCTNCNGLGLVDKIDDKEVVFAQEVCPECAGTGKVGEAEVVAEPEGVLAKIKRVVKRK